MTVKEIADIKEKYYKALYATRPAFKIYGDIKMDWGWKIMEEVLRDEKTRKSRETHQKKSII